LTNKQAILEILTQAKGIKLITHERPDIDALGSVAGTGWVLQEMGVPHASVVESWLSFDDELRPVDDYQVLDLQMMLDLHDLRRSYGFDESLHTIVVDHHGLDTVEFVGIIDDKCCATTALLSEIFNPWLNEKSSTCYLAGLLSDTGVLAYSNVDVRCLNDAIHLIRAGASWSQAYREATKICGVSQARRIAMLLSMVAEYRPGVFLLKVSKDDRERYGFTDADFTVALSIMQWIGEGSLFITARESETGDQVNISFRSRAPFEAIAYAKVLGGGGHRMAAAAKVNRPLSEVLTIVLDMIDKDCEQRGDPVNLTFSNVDRSLASIYEQSELLSAGVDEKLLGEVLELIKQGASAENAVKLVRRNIDLVELEGVASWVLSTPDLSNPKSFAQKVFARQVDFSCQT
jgi:phosphoesterase RecJ-like protein